MGRAEIIPRSFRKRQSLAVYLCSVIVVIFTIQVSEGSGVTSENSLRDGDLEEGGGGKFDRPKIKLSKIEMEFGMVVSSKTVLRWTDVNVTKIVTEDGTEENEIEDEDVDEYGGPDDDGIRPGGRNGAVTQKLMRLECLSNFPVEFSYEGCGAPYNITTKSFRHVKKFTDHTSYTFSTVLDFSSNAERHTGLFVCGAVRNASANGTQPLEGAPTTSFRLFVKGKSLFYSRKNTTIELERNSTSFLIPCAISNPSAYSSVKLYRIVTKEPIAALFDLNKGFHVQIKQGDTGLLDAQGTYICEDDKGRRSPHFKVKIPTEVYHRITPNLSYIRVVPGEKQSFKCESKNGNVTFTFSGDRQPRPPRKVNSEVNYTSEFPYGALYEITPSEMSSEHTVINCVSAYDGSIIHTWEYTTYPDVSISKFFFDGNKRYQDAKYICCSESYYKPKLEYILCRTETECEMKKHILDEDSDLKEALLEEYAVRMSFLNDSCIMFQPHFKFTLQTGLLRCSVEGVKSRVQKDYLYYFNPYRIYQAFTDDRFDHLKVISSDSIMKMSKTPSKNTLIGQKTRFLCYYNEFFIANGIVWSLEMKNGSMTYFDQLENLQTGNTSFSQLEISLDNIDVSVIRCHAPVRSSPYEWRNLSGPVFVRDLPKIQALWTSEDSLTQKVISGNLSESHDLILEAPLIPEGGFVVLECNASFPLDWVYSSGEGLPEMDFQAYRYTDRVVTNYHNYTYSARLKFFKVNSQLVGKYSCISANREFGHRGKEEDLKADFYIYVPGVNLFTNENNQTVRVWEYRESVMIPCPVADPRVNVTLHKFNNETNTWDNIDPSGKILEYSPMTGYVLSKNATKSLYGSYRCEATCKSDIRHVSGVYTVTLPFDPATRLTPFQKQVQIYPNETQLFKCEAKEEVTLIFSDKDSRDLIYEKEPSSQFPFSVSYKTALEEFSNFTIINCTTKGNDSRVLHTWEFYPDDPSFIDSFSFDNSTGHLVCCTKPYRDPVFEWMNCSSISECYNRQAPCLRQNKCQSAYKFLPGEIDYSQREKGCIGMNITDKPQGFVRCVVTGVHKIVSQAYLYYYNVQENYEIHDGYFLAPRVFEKFSVPNDKIMTIQIDGGETNENLTTGIPIKFFCSSSKFFSGAELKWAFERLDGTFEYVLGRDLRKYQNVESEVVMTFPDSNWKSVYCLAPNWNEYYGWRNVSLPLSFT